LGAIDGTALIGHDFVIGVHLREHATMIPSRRRTPTSKAEGRHKVEIGVLRQNAAG
jgi:hypothetical protein